MADPVSWLLVERGWRVLDAEGTEVGRVDEVLGDEQTGIFHGLVVDGDEVLAERIDEMFEGEIRLK